MLHLFISFTYFSMLSFQINLGIYMQDNRAEFSVLVDRSIGGSSTVDGQIDLMLHRHVLIEILDFNYFTKYTN